MKSTFLGIILSLTITAVVIVFTVSNSADFLNPLGILIVLGGTLSASIVTFGVGDIIRVAKIALSVFAKDHYPLKKAAEEIIHIATDIHQNPEKISQYSKTDGVHFFIKDGLRLIENDFTQEQIEEIMMASLVEKRNHHLHDADIIKTMSKYPPAFGMIGTVIGLVGILQNLGGEGGMEHMGPSMAVALITTLYGLFLSNYFFIPMSDNLLHRLDNEIKVRKLILKGVLLISEKKDPVYTEEVVTAHLLPHERKIT